MTPRADEPYSERRGRLSGRKKGRLRRYNPPVRNNVVLVVEDDPELRLLLTTMLELENRDVIGAVNGEEALRLARDHEPGVIVLDLMLPQMSGEQFREAQLANGKIKHIPVV